MFLDPIINFLIQVVTLRGNFRWEYVWKYLFNVHILQGVVLTIFLSVVAQFFGFAIGLILYFLRRSRSRTLRTLGGGYVGFFRGTPLLVQILVIYTLIPYLGFVQPLNSIDLFGPLGFSNIFTDSILTAILGLSLNEGAYMAEIVRAGIDSIDAGQLEAAKSLGMPYGLAMRRIVLPQALRVIVPPLGNEFNGMLKNSSLASVISLSELLGTAQSFSRPIFAPLELYLVASVWYLTLTGVWTLIQSRIERRLNASNLDPALRSQRSWWQRTFEFGGRERRVAPAGAGGPEVALPLPGGDRGAR